LLLSLRFDQNIPLFLVLEPIRKGRSVSVWRERASCPKAKASATSMPSCFSHRTPNQRRVGCSRRRPISWTDQLQRIKKVSVIPKQGGICHICCNITVPQCGVGPASWNVASGNCLGTLLSSLGWILLCCIQAWLPTPTQSKGVVLTDLKSSIWYLFGHSRVEGRVKVQAAAPKVKIMTAVSDYGFILGCSIVSL